MKIKKFIAVFLIVCLLLTSLPVTVFATPTLKEGNYEKWVDRIDDLPDYATEFYNWLITNSKKGGALRTGVTDTVLPGDDPGYGYLVEYVEGEDVTFQYEKSEEDNILNKLKSICSAEAKAKVDEIRQYVLAMFSAFVRDNPQVFWLSNTVKTYPLIKYYCSTYPSKLMCVGGYKIEFYFIINNSSYDIRNSGYLSSDSIDAMEKNINDSINEIFSGNYPVNGSRKDKLSYFNDYLTKTNSFNNSTNLSYIDDSCRTCEAALIGRTGTEGPVCESYAEAFKVLCDKADIPCVIVNGTADNGYSKSGHMWNYVQMDNGKWYAVDVSWNDPTVNNSALGAVSGYENRDYFLIGSETVNGTMKFSDSHVVENNFFENGLRFSNGPVLSELSYDEDIKNAGQVQYGKIKKASVTFGQDLSFKFTVTINGNFSDVYLKVTGDVFDEVLYGTPTGNEKEYAFVLDKVFPQYMGEMFDMELYCDGILADSIHDYSMVKYLKNIFNNTSSDKLKIFIADILEYGTAAQIYTSHDAENPVNMMLEGLKPTQFVDVTSSDVSISETTSDKYSFKSASVLCDYKNNFIIKFKAEDLSKVDIRVNGVVNPKDKIQVQDGSLGLYAFYSEDLFATQFNDIFTFELLVDGKVVQTLTYSLKSYVYSKQNEMDENNNLTATALLTRALYNYGLSGTEYANSL